MTHRPSGPTPPASKISLFSLIRSRACWRCPFAAVSRAWKNWLMTPGSHSGRRLTVQMIQNLVGIVGERRVDVCVGDEDGVGVEPVLELHRREPRGQGDAGAEDVEGELGRGEHPQPCAGDVVGVERRLRAGAGPDELLVETPSTEDVPAILVEVDQRPAERERHEVGHPGADPVARVGPAPGIRDLRAGVALEKHREVERAAAAGVDVIELDARLVEPHLEDAGLKRDLQPASGQEQGAARSPLRRGHERTSRSTLPTARTFADSSRPRCSASLSSPGDDHPSST